MSAVEKLLDRLPEGCDYVRIDSVREAIEADREGPEGAVPEGYEERWVNPMDYDDLMEAIEYRGYMTLEPEHVRILVPTSPEEGGGV